VALQVEIKLGRVNHVTVHDGTSRAIPTSICVPRRWEEADVVALSNDNDGNLGSYSYFLARI